MGFTSQTCCCCISAKTGTKVLGFFAALGLLSQLTEFNPLTLAANGVMTIAFLLMVMDDSASKRKLFFYCYLFGALVMYFFGIYQAYA